MFLELYLYQNRAEGVGIKQAVCHEMTDPITDTEESGYISKLRPLELSTLSWSHIRRVYLKEDDPGIVLEQFG